MSGNKYENTTHVAQIFKQGTLVHKRENDVRMDESMQNANVRKHMIAHCTPSLCLVCEFFPTNGVLKVLVEYLAIFVSYQVRYPANQVFVC